MSRTQSHNKMNIQNVYNVEFLQIGSQICSSMYNGIITIRNANLLQPNVHANIHALFKFICYQQLKIIAYLRSGVTIPVVVTWVSRAN